MREWRRTKTTWGEREERIILCRLECMEWDRLFSFVYFRSSFYIRAFSFFSVRVLRPETEISLTIWPFARSHRLRPIRCLSCILY